MFWKFTEYPINALNLSCWYTTRVLQNYSIPHHTVANTINVTYKVHMHPVELAKSWNLIVAFFQTGKGLLVLENSGNLLNLSEKYEMYGTETVGRMNILKILGVS